MQKDDLLQLHKQRGLSLPASGGKEDLKGGPGISNPVLQVGIAEVDDAVGGVPVSVCGQGVVRSIRGWPERAACFRAGNNGGKEGRAAAEDPASHCNCSMLCLPCDAAPVTCMARGPCMQPSVPCVLM